MSYGKIGLTTVAVTHDLLPAIQLVLLKKKLILLWNSILPEPGQPSAQLSKLIRLTACNKTKHNKRVVLDSLYPMINRLLQHAQGQTLAEF